MAYSKNSGIVDLIGGLFGLFILVSVVSNGFKFDFWPTAGILVGVYALLIIWAHTNIAFRKWKALRKPCAHGVKRGKDGGCSTCALDELKRSLEAKVYQAEQERKKGIRERADALHRSELASLRKKWLSRCELYLQMNPREFENAIAQLFKELGYEVKQTPFSNDRGKDAILLKGGFKYLVECKRYEANNKIGRRDLQIFVEAMKEENAIGGYYVNTGCFASTAVAYAKANQIELIDRFRLPVLVNSAYPVRGEIDAANVMCLECGTVERLPVSESPSCSVCANGHTLTNKITQQLVCSNRFASDSSCERCGSDLRLVTGRYRKFWGCIKYPKCRYTKRYQAGS